MKPFAVTGFLLLSIFLSSPSYAQNTALLHVPINPISADEKDIFIGRGKSVEIRFINESDSADVKVFPEPPIAVTSLSTGKTCTIDGGVWVRDSVYFCPDEKVMMVQEFTGSNDFLKFYNTTTCAKVWEIDISDAKWELLQSELLVTRMSAANGTCAKKTSLKKLCAPEASLK